MAEPMVGSGIWRLGEWANGLITTVGAAAERQLVQNFSKK
jgi:hypothetical protein